MFETADFDWLCQERQRFVLRFHVLLQESQRSPLEYP